MNEEVCPACGDQSPFNVLCDTCDGKGKVEPEIKMEDLILTDEDKEKLDAAWRKTRGDRGKMSGQSSTTTSLQLDPEASAALERWQKVSQKLTDDQQGRIDMLVSNLESCLRFANGKVWLDLRANTLLAGVLYDVDWFPDPPKGRIAAVEATRRKHEEESSTDRDAE